MKTAFIVFDNMTFLDFIGFYDAVTRLKTMKFMDDFSWNVCARAGQPTAQVTDDRGLKVVADTVGGSLGSFGYWIWCTRWTTGGAPLGGLS